MIDLNFTYPPCFRSQCYTISGPNHPRNFVETHIKNVNFDVPGIHGPWGCFLILERILNASPLGTTFTADSSAKFRGVFVDNKTLDSRTVLE